MVFSGNALGFWLVGLGPRQQVVKLTIRLAIDDFGDDVGQIGKGLKIIEPGRFDERGEGRPVFGPGARACKQGVLPIEGNRPDGTLDGIGVDLDTAVIDETDQSIPA